MLSSVRSPRQIINGAGSASTVGALAGSLGKTALLVSDPTISKHPGFDVVSRSLEQAGVTVVPFLDAQAELPLTTIDAACEVASQAEVDVIVAIGGGSVIDLGKVVAVLLTHGGSVRDYYGECQVPGPTLPLVALPTTAGTGSEVTPVAVVSDPERDLKVGFSSVFAIPTFAICDPELTLSCPRGVTAHSGIDALCHAVESFTAITRPLTPGSFVDSVFVGKNVVSDEFALRAVRGLAKSLRTAVDDGQNLEARTDVMQASTLAGVAFAHSGTGAPHAMQYPIGADTKTPHGLGVGLLLPYVLTVNRTIVTAELRTLAQCAGVATEGASALADADAFIDWVWDLNGHIGIPRSLQEIGLERASIPDVARRTSTVTRLLQNDPGTPDIPALELILDAAWQGDRDILIG